MSLHPEEPMSREADDLSEARPTLPMQRRTGELVEPRHSLLRQDAWEAHRLALEHYLFNHVLAGNYAAPIRTPYRILDVGCGHGHWVLDMAREFPKASVIGIDIAPPPPSASTANAQFIKANILEELPFNRSIFDFIHMRLMAMALPSQKWQRVLSELRRVTLPGGWVEVMELGMPLSKAPDTEMWHWLDTLGKYHGLELFPGANLGAWLHKSGLVNIQQRELMHNRQGSNGVTAQLLLKDYLSVAEMLRDEILSKGITSAKRYDTLLMQMHRQVIVSRPPETLPVYVAWGQVPRA